MEKITLDRAGLEAAIDAHMKWEGWARCATQDFSDQQRDILRQQTEAAIRAYITTLGSASPVGVALTAKQIADRLGVTPTSDIRPYVIQAVELARSTLTPPALAVTEEPDIATAILKQLTRLSVGSCSCGVKSPDLQWHEAGCRYRLAEEIRENVEALLAALATPAPVVVEEPIGYMRSKDNDGTSFWVSKMKNAYYDKPVYATSTPPPTVGADREALIGRLWRELLEKDDRTSPAEYPDMALITFAEFRAALEALTEPVAEGWVCAARKQGTAGGNDPVDCNWPICGCDPHADKVIEALQDSGLLASPADGGKP